MDSPFFVLSPEGGQAPSAVSQIKEQIDSLLTLLAQQEEALHEARLMLRRANTEVILYGKAPPPDYIASLGGDFESRLFIVGTMELIDREQLFHSDGSALFSHHEVELMKSAIYRVFETVLGPFCIASCCESDIAFANILINLLDEDQPKRKILKGINGAMQSAIELIERNYGIALTTAASSIVEGYEKLPGARIEAYHALLQKLSYTQIANTNVIKPAAETISALPQPNAKLEKQYYQYILSRDLELAEGALRRLIAEDFKSGISFDLTKLRFINHAESLLNIVGISPADMRLYLHPLDSEEAIYDLLGELFCDVREQVSADEQNQQARIDEIAVYIEKNYEDCNLCLAKLCDIFQMSQSTLSRTFKKYRGIGILDYIHIQRLLHVKSHLLDPSLNIDEIWQSTGFTNRRTFNRTFRKHEGMSASEYRRSILGLP